MKHLIQSAWSNRRPYNLSRLVKRASVPKDFEGDVPETPGAYVIYKTGETDPGNAILDIGECGPRLGWRPHGLRGRLASRVPHSASERIAADIREGGLKSDHLFVVWMACASKADAKLMQDGLISLFVREFGRQPAYNRKREYCADASGFEAIYDGLKALVSSSVGGVRGRKAST